MPKITFKKSKTFEKLTSYLERIRRDYYTDIANKYGQKGVDALSAATPVDTGLTASSWYYEIENQNDSITITWYNRNLQDDWFNVALMLQLGHGTRNGGWVSGTDYINPALEPIFKNLAHEMWLEVTKE